MSPTFKDYAALIAAHLRPQAFRVLLLAVALLGNTALLLLMPQITRAFIDTALSGAAMERLTVIAISLILVSLAQQGTRVGITYIGETVGWTATNEMRYNLTEHCLGLDMSFHDRHTPGEMIERIDGDTNTLFHLYSRFVLQVLNNGIVILGAMILLFREHLFVGAVISAFVGFNFYVLYRIRNLIVPRWRAAREASARYFGFLEERLGGIEDIRTAGAVGYIVQGFYDRLRAFWSTTTVAEVLGFITFHIAQILFALGVAIAFVLSANLYANGIMTLGAVYLVVQYAIMVTHPIEGIINEIEGLQQAGASTGRILELQRTQSRIVSVEQGRPAGLPFADAVTVEFEKVSFTYPRVNQEDSSTDTSAALQDVSFRLEAGKILGLLGRTGSGKTTLSRLLFRLYDPTTGRIRLSNRDIRHIPLADLRAHIGLVTQNVQLFHATIRDNLLFFSRDIADDAIVQALDGLGLTEWYGRLANGLDTMLEPGGGLSAGEAQLLAFARVFLKDPGLVILDEASSRLDPGTERLLERGIATLLKNRTAIIAAHRLSSLNRADEILILDGGRIIEYGARAALACDPSSRYSRLLQRDMNSALE